MDGSLLADGIAVCRITSGEIEGWLNRPFDAGMQTTNIHWMASAIHIDEAVDAPSKAGVQTGRMLRDLADALQLLTQQSVSILFSETFETHGFEFGSRWSSGFPTARVALPIDLNQARLEMWSRYYQSVTSVTDRRLEQALRRWNDSFWKPSEADRLIDYWIALEGLFAASGSTSELKFRCALRIAHYLGVTPDERAAIFKTVKDSYDLRSRVVHGANPKLSDLVQKTGDIVRRVLIQCLVDKQDIQADNMEADLLKLSARSESNASIDGDS